MLKGLPRRVQLLLHAVDVSQKTQKLDNLPTVSPEKGTTGLRPEVFLIAKQ